MARDEHNKAAEYHEHAAKSHRAAAEHHGKGDHAKEKNIQQALSSIPKMLANTASKPTARANSRSDDKGPTQSRASYVWKERAHAAAGKRLPSAF